jgi:hypothetical protein
MAKSSRSKATGNVDTCVSTARYATSRVCGRSSSCNPRLITNYFKSYRRDSSENKKTVDAVDVVDPEPTVFNGIELNRNSCYPNMYKFKYKKCSDKRCKLCPKANTWQISDQYKNKTFCKVYNCIYMITCTVCKLSYIGQTQNTVNRRINLHRSNIYRCKDNEDEWSLEIIHFKNHGVDNITISIIDVIPNKCKRIWWESRHMSLYNTVYPYGLNTIVYERTYNLSNVVSNSTPSVMNIVNYCVGGTSPNLRRKQRGRRRGKFSFQDYLEQFKLLCDEINKKPDYPIKWVKNFIFSVKKIWLQKLWKYCIGKDLKIIFPNNKQFIPIILDLIKFRSHCNKVVLEEPEKEDEIDKLFFVINYANRRFDNISFAKIFGRYMIYFPVGNVHISNSFKYGRPTGRIIFNYNGISKNLVTETPNACNCVNTLLGFNEHYGHVITGNTDVANNYELTELMNRGTGYRIGYYNNAIPQFKQNLERFIYSTAIKYSMPYSAFEEWKYYVVNDFIDEYSRVRYKDDQVKLHLMRSYIKHLQDRFVITYVDKVASNYAFICKKLYCELLTNSYNDTTIYKKLDLKQCIIENRIRAFYRRAGFKIGDFKFPYLVLIPKFHKFPVKFRTVTVGCNTYLTDANNKLLSLLKIVYKTLIKEGGYFINNSLTVVKHIKGIEGITDIKSYDFTDLFNSIDLRDLYSIILGLFEKYDLQSYISINKYRALLDLVLNETILYNGTNFYKQIHGIPMGGGCSSALADIYLHFYERGVMLLNELLFFRYVDDILVCFNENVKSIDLSFYPDNLKLVETEKDNRGCLVFLDLSLKISEHQRISYTIYDKRDTYNFKTVRIMSWNSNLHKNIKRNVIINQLIRCQRLHSDIVNMDKRIKFFIKMACDHGFPLLFLKSILKQFFDISSEICCKRFL